MILQSDSTALILASASPRRAELLEQIGLSFKVCPANIDETPKPNEPAKAYVVRMSEEKARAGLHQQKAKDITVLAADTTVVLANDLLGKPSSMQHAESMLRRLSGSQHQVISSVTVARSGLSKTAVSISDVNFRPLSDLEIRRYVETREPMDKAGAYAIQGLAAVFIEKIQGSYSGIMGLPLAETYQLLKAMDVISNE